MCLSPLHRRPRAASTPAAVIKPSLRLRGFPPRSPVPPSWFLATSTVSSASRVAGLLHPAADPGVHRVSACWCPGPKTATFLRFPAVQVRTPRRTPLRQPQRVAASVAPLPFSPDHRLASAGSVAGGPVSSGWEDRERRLRGLAPSSGLVSSPPLPVGRRSAPSWASFLLKVLRRAWRSRLLSRCPFRALRVAPVGLSVRCAPLRLRSAAEAVVREGVLSGTALRRAAGAARVAPRDRGVQPKLSTGTRSGRNPSEVSSFRPGEPGLLRCRRSLSGAEVARGGPPRVSPIRNSDPR